MDSKQQSNQRSNKWWIKLIVFLVLMAAILLLTSTFLCVANEKDAVGVYGFFLEPEDSLDVVLIGPSALYASYYSPLAYEEQGFTSYAISTSQMRGSLYRYAAELAIEKQHPQLLIIETFGFTYEDQEDEISLAKFIDALPNSEIKQRAISEIVPEELQASFRMPFERYHSSWNRVSDLAPVFRDKIQLRLQGYSITKNFGTTPFRQQFIQRSVDYEITEEGFQYLQILLDYLQGADVEHVLFVRCPCMVQYNGTESYQKMVEMIRNAGFDYVNLCAAVGDMGLDVTHDYYNTTHMNVYGAEKFTSFLAGYIMARYELSTEHDEKVTKEWDNCASYNVQILDYIKDLTDRDVNGFLYTQKDFLGGFQITA